MLYFLNLLSNNKAKEKKAVRAMKRIKETVDELYPSKRR